jgi:polar amino acid transport system permease protein
MVSLDFAAVLVDWPLLLRGLGVTAGLTAVAATLGLALGIACAWARVHGGVALRWGAGVYIELIRNTPFIVQLFFVFFGLPSLVIKMSALMAAVLAMTINLTAYAIEIVRAGIEAVPPGQREAGIALGLAPVSVFIYIILPQAIATVYPALVSQIVITMLESAVVSQIAVTDLTHAGDFIQSRTYRAFETYFVIAVIYLCLAIVLRWAFDRAGRRLFAGRR